MEHSVEQHRSSEVISPAQLLEHWQGHRRVTRRTIEAFPEEALFTHSIGGMRTFAEMVSELLAIAVPGLREILTGETAQFRHAIPHGNKKETLLALWDEATTELDSLWTNLKAKSFQDAVKTFGQYEGTVQSSLFYFIDNEIHHRAQGYVYLRSLDVEPPFFWERN